MKKNSATILLFHRVHPVRDPMWDPMDPAKFDRILQFVKKKYTVLPLLEILHQIPAGKKPVAAVTFDDGYRDFIEYSLPIMENLQIPSSLYVVTDCISKGRPTWTFEVDYLFSHTNRLKIHWSQDMDFLPENLRQDKFVNKQELIKFCLVFKQYIKKVQSEKRNIMIADLFRSFDDVSIPGNLMMTWAEVNQVISAGVEVGSHTVTHSPLATLAPDELDMELQQSRTAYFEHTGAMPQVISYPVGSYNQQVKQAATAAGYQFGLAVNHRRYDADIQDDFEIPRVELYNEPFWKSWMRMKGYV